MILVVSSGNPAPAPQPRRVDCSEYRKPILENEMSGGLTRLLGPFVDWIATIYAASDSVTIILTGLEGLPGNLQLKIAQIFYETLLEKASRPGRIMIETDKNLLSILERESAVHFANSSLSSISN